jgi:hypothetical protein
MSFTSVSALGLEIADTVMGETFTMRGRQYHGIIDDVVASEMFAAGGSIPSEPISVTMKLQTFTPALTNGERITARSRNYTVRQVSRDEVSITLICESVAKR